MSEYTSLARKWVDVTKSVAAGWWDGKGIVESTTKTKRDRHVPVPEPVWKKVKIELPADPDALVFPSRKGGFLPLGEYRWAFDNAAQKSVSMGRYLTA